MTGLSLVLSLLVSSAPMVGNGRPTNQELLFYNARIALREKRPGDVVKLWLLRNSLAQRGDHGRQDADFRSVLWAALGELGYCQDGLARDGDDGAGIWPLALHNWLLQAVGKGPPRSQPAPWNAYRAGKQQRSISLHDVLSAEEHRSAAFFRTDCLLPYMALAGAARPAWFDVKDRLSVGVLMRDLLSKSRATLQANKVANIAVIEARIFDLDLVLAQMQMQRAKKEAGIASQLARRIGLSETAAADVRDEVTKQWPVDSPQADFLRRSLTWTPQAWLDLSPARRLSLFSQAKPLAVDQEKLNALVLGIIDELCARKQGAEVESFIGLSGAMESPRMRQALSSGARGQRLLDLEPATGFRGRGAIALQRGVEFLETGARDDALRSFAYAMGHAEESKDGEPTRALARRWLSYVLAQYQTTESVLATLQALVPRRDFNEVVEDLAWRAALRADAASFEQIAASINEGGALDARIEQLRPLAQGKPKDLAMLMRDKSEKGPHATLAFLDELLDQLEKESAEVRLAQSETLELIVAVVRPMVSTDKAARSQSRKAAAMLDRVQAILDGLGQLHLLEDAKSRSMSPSRETFAGSIRLAPADALPWPFVVPAAEAPSAFAPLILQPIEWRDEHGALVFGWRLTE